jgi:hypothetical protein
MALYATPGLPGRPGLAPLIILIKVFKALAKTGDSARQSMRVAYCAFLGSELVPGLALSLKILYNPILNRL